MKIVRGSRKLVVSLLAVAVVLLGVTVGTPNASAQDLDPKKALITGSVVEAAGLSPVSGVKVDLFAAGPDWSRGSWIGQGATFVDGLYQFEIEAGCVFVIFTAPADRTFDTRPASVWYERRLCVDEGEHSANNNAVLQGNTAVTASVSTEGGTAVPGTRLTLYTALGDGSRGTYLVDATTGADGRFVFADRGPGCYLIDFQAPAGSTFVSGSEWARKLVCVGDTWFIDGIAVATIASPGIGTTVLAADDAVSATRGQSLALDVTLNDVVEGGTIGRVVLVDDKCASVVDKVSLSVDGRLTGDVVGEGICELLYDLVANDGTTDRAMVTITSTDPVRRVCVSDAGRGKAWISMYHLRMDTDTPVFFTSSGGHLAVWGDYDTTLFTDGDLVSVDSLGPVDTSFELTNGRFSAFMVPGDTPTMRLIFDTPGGGDFLRHRRLILDDPTFDGDPSRYRAQPSAKRVTLDDFPDLWAGTFTAIENGVTVQHSFELCIDEYSFSDTIYNVKNDRAVPAGPGLR